MKTILKLTFLLVCFGIFFGCKKTAETTEKTTATTNLKTTEFSVEGMTCKGCVATITKTLQKGDGITEVKVDLETRKATITYDSVTTNSTKIEVLVTGIKNGKYSVNKSCKTGCKTGCKKACCSSKNSTEKKCKPDCKKECCKKA